MASAKRDFERFVEWLHLPATQAPPEVKRLTNLALANFDGLARTVRQHSQRSTYLVERARRDLAQTPDGPPGILAAAADGAWPWKRLRNMTIGPFRGFRTPEPFDLKKRVILFYGPNGSGKTSFCEGLEYGLLGSVEEAETKRIDGRTYLANLHERRFEPPVLRATDNQNREVAVDSNSDTYRFCFIEKNRIDAFSRIAARPPAQRTELIATLFGMDTRFRMDCTSSTVAEGKLVSMSQTPTQACPSLNNTTGRSPACSKQAAKNMARSRQVATRPSRMRSGVRIFCPSEPKDAGGSAY